MKITNVHNLPQELVSAITFRKPSIDRISVTQLIDSPRIRMLTIRHWGKLEEDVSQRIWALLGLGCHAVLEKKEGGDSLSEEPLQAKFNGKIISGRPDLLTGSILRDWKCTSVWSVIFSPKGKDEWIRQINVYKWLFGQHNFPVERAEVIAILRDWQRSKAKHDSNYPQLPVRAIEIPIWGNERLNQYLGNRVTIHTQAEGLPDNELPDCTDEEKWAQATKYAVKKENRKTAIRVFDTTEQAYNFQGLQAKKDKTYVDKRPGKCTRCEDYCAVKNICNKLKGVI